MKFFSLGKSDDKDRREKGQDRRTGANSDYRGPERRKGGDRRGLDVGLKFKTARPLGPIEDWLVSHYPDTHRLQIAGMSDDFSVKEVQIVFATVEQRETFKLALSNYLTNGTMYLPKDDGA